MSAGSSRHPVQRSFYVRGEKYLSPLESIGSSGVPVAQFGHTATDEDALTETDPLGEGEVDLMEGEGGGMGIGG